MNFQEADSIPGMIEPSERELLYRTSQSLDFARGDAVVEFGAFLGRSANCIAQGLARNETFTGDCAFCSYDSFECDEDGGFVPTICSQRRVSTNRIQVLDAEALRTGPLLTLHALALFVISNASQRRFDGLHDVIDLPPLQTVPHRQADQTLALPGRVDVVSMKS